MLFYRHISKVLDVYCVFHVQLKELLLCKILKKKKKEEEEEGEESPIAEKKKGCAHRGEET